MSHCELAQVRQVHASEWELVREIRLAAMKDAPHAFGSTYEREVSLTENEWRSRFTNGVWFVAFAGDMPIGLAAGVGPQCDPPLERELVSMWTHPDHRGTGVAAELAQAVRSWAKTEGANTLTLWVADDNERARRFYEKLGFASTGRRERMGNNPARGQEELQSAIG